MTNKEHEALAKKISDVIVNGLINKQTCDQIAQAAIAAVLEAISVPTREMLEAGAKGSGEDSEDVAAGAWEDMIAASPLVNGGNGNG